MTAPRYLIIGGAPKSATTSLFRYLGDHPAVCPASRKETYFFAREFDYGRTCTAAETFEGFQGYFAHCQTPDAVRLEATPYTLYSKSAARKIADILPDATILFILRDPVQRLYSDYRFHVHREHPSAKGTFAEFVEGQRQMRTGVPNLLELGCYIQYMRPFFDTFGKDRVITLCFENLRKDPVAEMRKLCDVLGIEKEFYSSYDSFMTQNRTLDVRFSSLNRLYMHLEPVVAGLRARVMHSRAAHGVFENLLNAGKTAYFTLNNRQARTRDRIPPALEEELDEYYRPHSEALSEALGRPLPWPSLKVPALAEQESRERTA